MNLWVIFLTGLTTGGLSCLAMQGGLLAGVITNQKDAEQDELQHDKQARKAAKKQAYLRQQQQRSFTGFDTLDWLPVALFLGAKLITHTLLGFLLGFLGESISLSLGVRLSFQVFTALFMFATAMNLLNVHPIFRYVAFQPPKFMQKWVRSASGSTSVFAPAVLGALTIFVPCGVTQAMEVLAITTGNAIQGALIMFAFVLGTSPLFALLGVATAKLSEGWYQNFSRFAAAVLIAMAVYGFNGVLIVLNSPVSFASVTRPVTYFFSDERFASAPTAAVQNGVQQVTINILNTGYSPNYIKVQAGMPVQLTLQSDKVYSCALAFMLPEFGIDTFLDATDTETYTFTPQKKGRYTFTCSMGMYTGVLEVI